MPWYPVEFEPLLAIAAATLDRNATLIEANAGFRELIKVDGTPLPIGTVVTRFFIQPNFETIAGAPDRPGGEIYNGPMTVGEVNGRTRSLRARIWRVDAQIRVLAEYDVKELERLADTVLELNRDYANVQLELVQTNLRLQQREAEIRALSLTDQLTGVGNRRKLEQALASETGRVERTGEKLCAFMADLDHFKRINDTYGHEAGDKVLAAFGDLLRRYTRTIDVVGRFGGEEFVVLMPHTKLERAIAAAERVREVFARTRIEPLPHPVTVSVGIAEHAPGESGEALLRRIDKALYEAKRLGRNRVVVG